MNSKFVLPLAVAACLPFTSTSRAATYTEIGDAGETLATAQLVPFGPLLNTTTLQGQLTLTNGLSDCDLYQIFISDPASFSASMTSFAPGANNFDSQLALFNALGQGVILNDDDAATDSPQSNLPTGNALLSAQGVGLYYLLVGGSGRYAVDGNGNLIFPNYTDGVTDPTATVGPNNAAGSLAGYTGASSEGGAYSITLLGVPEPSAGWLVFTGAAAVAVLQRARRRAAR